MRPTATQSSGNQTREIAATTAPAATRSDTRRMSGPEARSIAATAIGSIALG